jgi:hypothetical protein
MMPPIPWKRSSDLADIKRAEWMWPVSTRRVTSVLCDRYLSRRLDRSSCDRGPQAKKRNKERAMRHIDDAEPFTKSRRKEIFRALVDAQDDRMSVLQSRAIVAKRFGIDVRQLKSIEQEGIDNEWPPL